MAKVTAMALATATAATFAAATQAAFDAGAENVDVIALARVAKDA